MNARRRWWWAAAAALPAFAACNQTVGECWPVGQGDGSDGTGAGVVGSTGVGASGDVPPSQPQSFKYPEADCNIVSQGSCNDKCEASYEAAAAECGKIAEDGQRKTCQDSAYATYKSCSASCVQANNDCRERCKQQCDKIHDQCHANCTKNDPTSSCHAKCNNDYAACLKKCDQDCKGG